MKLTILYDNIAPNNPSGLQTGWGFSCLIETNNRSILFDTGWDGGVLLKNMEELGLLDRKLDMVVISHKHWDHMGGLPQALQQFRPEYVVVPASFSQTLKQEIGTRSKVREIRGPEEIFPGVMSTGDMDSPDGPREQAVVLKTGKGLVLVTGCAHPGLARLMDRARKYGELHGVLGGFHDFKDIKALEGLEMLAPCHCSKQRGEIMKQFPRHFVPLGLGTSLEL
jgi:7,8-dihydropterin-6-yl-methyl-4-(beta-D-ribofuranosyl)aminobenzene 5'-phosphate synthase